jgi:hypothetical protein
MLYFEFLWGDIEGELSDNNVGNRGRGVLLLSSIVDQSLRAPQNLVVRTRRQGGNDSARNLFPIWSTFCTTITDNQHHKFLRQ